MSHAVKASFMRSVAKSKAIRPGPQSLQCFFGEALSQVTDAVIATDVHGRVLYMNAAAEKLSGRPAADAVMKLLPEVFSIVDVSNGKDFGDAIDEAHGADAHKREFRRALLLGCDERPTVIEYCVTPIRSKIASEAGSVIVLRDLMKLRNSEKALELSEATHLASTAALHEERERARVTLNAIGDAVISTDFRARVTFLNPIAEQMTGWTLEGATGRTLTEVFPLLDSQTRERISCPAMQAIIEDQTCRSGTTGVLVRPDGSEVAVDHTASPIHDAGGGVIGVVLVAHDVTAARNQADTLARLALYDSLTGLPNRMLLADRLEHALHSSRRSGLMTALLFIDLDRFKTVNDTHGHAVGDLLLQQAAQRLLGCVRNTDTVSRHGGDEFVVLLPDVHSVQDAELCAAKIIAAVNKPFDIEARDYLIGASIGIAAQHSFHEDAATLIKHADVAMYHAKSAGRNRISVFSHSMIYDLEHSLAASGSG
jgi:diguanylate cyclase (GGDEF)-like protein/PAS domain S-box-containing protein